MKNMPIVKLGLVAVSRDNFSNELATGRRACVAEEFGRYGKCYECPVLVEHEEDVDRALDDLASHEVNALVVYLGNFGPEVPEAMLAQKFQGPVMVAGAAEETVHGLMERRGDAYCGMLNACYNLGMRKRKVYLPKHPVGPAARIAYEMKEFLPVARAVIGMQSLKIITFGPRPHNFMACNAPVQPLLDLGVEIQENSDLDLYRAFQGHKNDSRIPGLAEEMRRELDENGKRSDLLETFAQYELTLLDWAKENRGSREYVAFANKCWPSFKETFGFVPCYVNSHLTGKGYVTACEVDIYGALSEFIGMCISKDEVTLLDINNTVPEDLYHSEIRGMAEEKDIFMGFHCGNTSSRKLRNPQLKYQYTMYRNSEAGKEPDITRGTMEGELLAGDVTIFRLQSTSGGKLQAYLAEGEVLPCGCHTYGSTAVISIPEMDRFYRYVLLEHQYPHHCAVAFSRIGKALFSVFGYLGISNISYNRPAHLPYPEENPYV